MTNKSEVREGERKNSIDSVCMSLSSLSQAPLSCSEAAWMKSITSHTEKHSETQASISTLRSRQTHNCTTHFTRLTVRLLDWRICFAKPKVAVPKSAQNSPLSLSLDQPDRPNQSAPSQVASLSLSLSLPLTGLCCVTFSMPRAQFITDTSLAHSHTLSHRSLYWHN